MHASFRSCARASSMGIFGLLLMCVPLLLAQNATIPAESKIDLPDAPMPATTALPAQNSRNVVRGELSPSLPASHSQSEPAMGKSLAFERPRFNTNALEYKGNRPGGKDAKSAGRFQANWFALDPASGHANRAVTHSGTQWYTSHIPWAGSIMQRGLKISKAHPHLTTVIKTLKPQL
jgi:hypothetical protein